MVQIIRTDIHCPSAIIPSDYRFVAFSIREMNYSYDGLLSVWAMEKTTLRRHMDATGGKWAEHQHGGSCMICGAHAIYLATYHHTASNEYICCGMDCADKMDMQDAARFRRLKDAIEAAQKSRAGLKKAEGFLAQRDLTHVWDIYVACTRPNKATLEGALRQAGLEGDDVARMALRDLFIEQGMDPDAQPVAEGYEERTIVDIVEKLRQYGSVSPKQVSFLAGLAKRISERPVANARKVEKESKWAEEKANAADVPTGRHKVTVTVLKTENRDDGYGGNRFVMTAKADAGYVVWGTVPSGCVNVDKGTRIELTATFEQSDKDPKFGFFKRPVGRVVS